MTEDNAAQSKKIFRILSLDGGGGKGIYSLGVLRELERSVGTTLNKHFDLFYGTSTGAIIATALAKGVAISDIVEFYYKDLPTIMKCFCASTRSKRLQSCLMAFFGNNTFSDLGNIGLGVVATNLHEKKPLIFKTLPSLAHGMKHSFDPGFGLTIVEALEASCSATPFFKAKSLNLKNASRIDAIDGGFVANNPSLYSLIDARKALSIEDANIRLLSIGTGMYPEKYPIYSYLSGLKLGPALKIISMQFASNANSIHSIFRLLANNVSYVRVSDTFADPELTTSLFEHRKNILERLLGKGRDSFAQQENDIKQTIIS